LVVQCKEGLDLANHLAAGAFEVEDLIEKTEEGASHRINALPVPSSAWARIPAGSSG
jgi:hypothetical protein